MTIRQRLLKLFYPLLIRTNKAGKMNTKILENVNHTKPNITVYDIPFELNNGQTATLSAYRNKKILIVNTASDCGYTNQYEGLQKLFEEHSDIIQLIGFPSNNFKEQEKGSDAEIAEFCKINYGVTFPLAKKSIVIKNGDQNEIFAWLSNKDKNGWLNEVPSWNFCKYLINEEGVLTHFFEAGIEPLSANVIEAITS